MNSTSANNISLLVTSTLSTAPWIPRTDINKLILYIGMAFFGFVSLLPNTALACVLWANKHLLRSSALICGLCFGDLVNGVSLVISSSLRITFWLKNTIDLNTTLKTCFLRSSTLWVMGCQMPSVMILVIGVDRFAAIAFYRWYHNNITNKRMWIVVAASFLFCLVLTMISWVHMLVDPNAPVSNSCATQQSIGVVYTSFLYGFSAMCGAVSCFLSLAAMLMFLRKRRTFNRQQAVDLMKDSSRGQTVTTHHWATSSEQGSAAMKGASSTRESDSTNKIVQGRPSVSHPPPQECIAPTRTINPVQELHINADDHTLNNQSHTARPILQLPNEVQPLTNLPHACMECVKTSELVVSGSHRFLEHTGASSRRSIQESNDSIGQNKVNTAALLPKFTPTIMSNNNGCGSSLDQSHLSSTKSKLSDQRLGQNKDWENEKGVKNKRIINGGQQKHQQQNTTATTAVESLQQSRVASFNRELRTTIAMTVVSTADLILVAIPYMLITATMIVYSDSLRTAAGYAFMLVCGRSITNIFVYLSLNSDIRQAFKHALCYRWRSSSKKSGKPVGGKGVKASHEIQRLNPILVRKRR